MVLLAIKRLKFPVIKNDKDKPSANHYYRSLLLAQNGFYPVSINKLVHGGIHFDQNVLAELGNENVRKVQCIADGEVIAYRVNDHYQKVDYGDKVGFFSTGFVLVRHLLEMDLIEEETSQATESNTSTDNANTQESEITANSAQSSNADTTTNSTTATTTTTSDTNASSTSNTTSTTATTESKNEKKTGHRLYFYSLYMHLADTKYYDDNPKEPTPAFWDQDIYQVTDKSLEFVKGLNIRHDPNRQILAVLQTGTKVNLNLELHDDKYKWYAVSSFVNGYSSIPILEPYDHAGHQILGWVYNRSGLQLTESVFDIQGEDTNLAKSKGLGIKNGSGTQNISMLPKGTQIKINGIKKAGQLVELTEIVRNGQPTLPLPDTKKTVKFDGLKQIARGKKYNEVVVLDKPFPIKVGDLVGHIGHNQNDSITKEKDKDGNYTDMETLPLGGGLKKSEFRPNLHVECFTCEDLSNYITKTQTEASKIPDKDKFFLAISKDAKLLPLNTPSDTTVGKPLEGTKIKVISKAINLKWLQIEIKIAEKETKQLWIENSSAIEKKAKPNENIELTENMPAWSQHPLQASNLTSSTSIVGTPLLLDLNDDKLGARDNRAEDEQDALWLRIEKVLDDKNMPIAGWVLIGSEGVKKVSCWDWFDFKPITESANLKEFYLSAEKTLKRNKNNSSLDQYTPTIKETLTILDKQYKSVQEKYAMIKTDCFKGIVDEPVLLTSLGRLLINYESEWYSKLDAESKMPKWEKLNSEMTENAQNILDYLNEGDEAKRDAYIKTLDASEQESVKKGLEEARREIQRFPEDYADNPSEKLSTVQFEIYKRIKELEKKVMIWEKTKEKAKKMLWWDDVVKGLAKQSQQTTESNSTAENKEGSDTSTTQADPTPPATLNQDGKAWYIHPVTMIELFSKRFKHVSYEQLSTIMSGCSSEKLETFLPYINDTMELFDIKTSLRKAHFLAQIAHETGKLVYMEEIASGQAYEGNTSLGNTNTGDGVKFKGRGLLQLTGRNNYTSCQRYLRTIKKYANLDITSSLENAKKVASNPELATLVSGYYWQKIKTKLNTKADEDDLYWVSVYVNGRKKQDNPYYPDKDKEPNNMADRAAKLEIAKKAFGVN